MKLSNKTWYNKLYFFIENWWCYFIGKDYRENVAYKNKTNLCAYMRVFIIKLPILILSQIILYSMLIGTFVIFPLYYLGFSIYLVTILTIVGSIVGLYYSGKVVHKFSEYRANKVRTSPSFWSIIKAWIKARKQNVCPLMEITDVE